MLILNHEELKDLTDRSQPAAQIRWLKERGWTFEVGRNCLPKVARTYFEKKMGIELPAETMNEIKNMDWRVNTNALRNKPNL